MRSREATLIIALSLSFAFAFAAGTARSDDATPSDNTHTTPALNLDSKKALTRAAALSIMKARKDDLASLSFTFEEVERHCPGMSNPDVLADALLAEMPPEFIVSEGGPVGFKEKIRHDLIEMQSETRERLSERKRLEQAAAAIQACVGFDFSTAAPYKLEGGEAREEELFKAICPDSAQFEDIKIFFKHDSRHASITLHAPLRLGARYGVTRGIECHLDLEAP